MIALMVEALKSSGLEDFQVSIGQVEYFKGICSQAGLDEETEDELRDYISSKNFSVPRSCWSGKPYAGIIVKFF